MECSLRHYTLWRGGRPGSPALRNTFGWLYLARHRVELNLCKVGYSLNLTRRSGEIGNFVMVWVWSLPKPQQFESRVLSWLTKFSRGGDEFPRESFLMPLDALFGVIRLAVLYQGVEMGFLRRVSRLSRLSFLKNYDRVVDGNVVLCAVGSKDATLDVGVLRALHISPEFPDARMRNPRPASGEFLFRVSDNVYGLWEGDMYPCQVHGYRGGKYVVRWYKATRRKLPALTGGRLEFETPRMFSNLSAWELTSMRVVFPKRYKDFPQFVTIELLRF